MKSNVIGIATHDTYRKIEEYRDLDRQIKALTTEKDAIKKLLVAGYFLNENDFVFEGRLIATYRPQLTITLNQSLLKENEPEIYKAYQDIKTIRKFLLK
jgi:hypothetical protein